MRTITTDQYPAPVNHRTPSLQEAMDYRVNESKRGVRLVRMGDLPDHVLRQYVDGAEQHERQYGHTTFRWQGLCAALVLRHRQTEVAPL